MNARVMLKIVAVVPLTALFAFARIEMANAYYDNPKAASEHATLTSAGGSGHVVTPSVPGPNGPQLTSQWFPASLSLSGTGSKTKSGTGSQSKNGGSKSGTGSQSKNHSGSKTGTGSKSVNGGSKTGTASKSKQGSGSASGTQSQTNTGTQSQSKHGDPPLLPIPGLGI